MASVGSVKGTAEFPSVSGGAIPTPTLQFRHTKLAEISRFIKLHHYSHTHPGGGDISFAVDWSGNLAGAMLFGYMAGNPKGMNVLEGLDDPSAYRELMRLVLLDELPFNTESRFIGWALRWLKKNTELAAVLSFADPHAGHNGCVYRATNWIYTGLQKRTVPRLIIDGVEVHPRMALDKYGTSSVTALVAAGHTVTTAIREPKHRYVYVLHPEWGLKLKYPQQSFVEGGSSGNHVRPCREAESR